MEEKIVGEFVLKIRLTEIDEKMHVQTASSRTNIPLEIVLVHAQNEINELTKIFLNNINKDRVFFGEKNEDK